jgi:hypothetical protein
MAKKKVVKKKKSTATSSAPPAKSNDSGKKPVKKKKPRPEGSPEPTSKTPSDSSQKSEKPKPVYGSFGGKDYETLDDLLRAIPDDYAHLRETTISHDMLKSQGLAHGDNHPLHPARLYTLLVGIIGHRQSTYTNLEELRDRRTRMQREKPSTRHAATQVMLDHFKAVCETEKSLTKLVVAYWPDMKLPHGAGANNPPPGLFVGSDDDLPKPKKLVKKKKKVKRNA